MIAIGKINRLIAPLCLKNEAIVTNSNKPKIFGDCLSNSALLTRNPAEARAKANGMSFQSVIVYRPTGIEVVSMIKRLTTNHRLVPFCRK